MQASLLEISRIKKEEGSEFGSNQLPLERIHFRSFSGCK